MAGVHVERVALVARYGHLAVVGGLCQLALHIAEVGPRGAVDAGELHEVEGHLIVVPGTAPAAHEGWELGGKELYIMCIRLALIPDEAAQGIARHLCNARLVEVAGLIGVALQGIGALLNIV